MARKTYSWAKGYDRRQKDRQRELEKRRLKKEKKRQQLTGKVDYSKMRKLEKQLQELAETAALAELEAKNYKKAWEAEKRVNRAQQEKIVSLQQSVKKQYKRGVLAGWLLSMTFVIIGFLISFAL